MADWDDVERIATALPQVEAGTSYGGRAWKVNGKGFVWERPLRKSDLAALEALGEPAPEGPILGASVTDLGDKQALLEQDPRVFFTVPHFDGYPAVLVRLAVVDDAVLTQTIIDAWLARAPKRLAERYQDPGQSPAD